MSLANGSLLRYWLRPKTPPIVWREIESNCGLRCGSIILYVATKRPAALSISTLSSYRPDNLSAGTSYRHRAKVGRALVHCKPPTALEGRIAVWCANFRNDMRNCRAAALKLLPTLSAASIHKSSGSKQPQTPKEDSELLINYIHLYTCPPPKHHSDRLGRFFNQMAALFKDSCFSLKPGVGAKTPPRLSPIHQTNVSSDWFWDWLFAQDDYKAFQFRGKYGVYLAALRYAALLFATICIVFAVLGVKVRLVRQSAYGNKLLMFVRQGFPGLAAKCL